MVRLNSPTHVLAAVEDKQQTRGQLQLNTDALYYGLVDEDDEVMLQLEQQAERLNIQRLLRKSAGETMDDEGTNGAPNLDFDLERLHSQSLASASILLQLPSEEDIQKLVVERKKQQLLQSLQST